MSRPDDLFNFNEWTEHMEIVLDQQFPKGKCKQRGNALVLYAEFQIFISYLVKDFGKSIKEIKDVLGEVTE